VEGENSTFAVKWRSLVASAPKLLSNPTAQNASATVVANAGAEGSIAATYDLRGAKLDGKDMAFEPAPSGTGFLLKDLKEGKRQLRIQNGSILLDVRADPSLNIFLSSGRNTGTLLVEAGQDNTRVYLNDRLYRRATEHGALLIAVETGTYSVRVAKDGFQASPAQTVAVNKGEEKEVRFTLTALPSVLEIAGAIAAARVMVDGKMIGETDANGNLRTEMSSGDHSIEIEKKDYTSVKFTDRFVPGKTIRPARQQLAMARAGKPVVIPVPDSPQQEEARDWERVRNSNNVDELDQFIGSHPSGSHVDEARVRMAQLRQQAQAKAEQAAWDAVDKTSRQAIQEFLARNPAGAHTQAARNLISDLEKREAESLASAQRPRAPSSQDQQEAVNRNAMDQQGIQRALAAYQNAYNSKNAAALQGIWPSIPKSTLKKLQSEFKDASTLTFQLQAAGPAAINGATASVACTRSTNFTGRDGARQSQTDQVRVILTRQGAAWVIQAITGI